MFDAIIVGARCAGSPTGMLLARKGYRVLILDRDTFPSDTMSTHYIWQAGVGYLQRWGLLDRLRATGCPPITRITLDFGDVVLSGCAPAADGCAREAFAPRRRVLDKILVDAAVEAGCEVREGMSVQELLFDTDSVTGVVARSRNGPVKEHARIVVGADGVHSLVARAVGAPKTIERETVGCGYYSYWSGVPANGGELYMRGNRTIILVPTNDELTCIAVIAPATDFEGYRKDIEGTYLAGIDRIPSVAERVRAGRRVERFAGAQFQNFFRKPYGPGWALVGDAGYHKDPYTAQGISDAFRDSELLADAIDDGFSGRVELETALSAYESTRDRTAMPEFESTVARAALNPPPPEMQNLLTALQGNQEQIDRFIGTDAGTVSHADFFSPENMERIMAKARVTHA